MTRAAALAALLALAAGPALAQARQQATVLMSEDPGERAFQERFGYADAVVHGDTVWLSGVVAGMRPGETSMEPAYTRAFDKLGSVLRRAGVGWGDVVEMTTYHTDVRTQLDAIAAVKARYMAAPHPAWTAIGVSRLLPDTGITEIRLVARKPGPPPPAR